MRTWSLRTLIPAVFLLAFTVVLARAEEPTNPAAAVVKSEIMITPAEVHWGPCPAASPPSAQCAVLEGDPQAANVLFSFRLKMPSGYKLAPHFHPADEHLFIVRGSFNMGMGDTFDETKTKPMVAGSFVVIPKGTHHFAWTRGETILQVYAIGPWALTYVNPKDDPRHK